MDFGCFFCSPRRPLESSALRSTFFVGTDDKVEADRPVDAPLFSPKEPGAAADDDARPDVKPKKMFLFSSIGTDE